VGVVDKAKGVIRSVDEFQRRRKPLAIGYGVVKKFGDDQAGNLAALISYYGFFSLFPLLLVLVSVLGFVLSGHPHLQHQILNSTLAQFPVIGDQLQKNTGHLPGSGTAIVIGLVGLVWAGLGAMQASENAMNEVWDVPRKDRPNFFKSKLRAIGMLAVLGVGIIAVTIIGSAGTFSSRIGIAGTIVGIVLSLIVTTGLFMLSFKVLTNRDLAWRTLFPGAVVGAVGWVVLQVIGGWYIGHQVKGASQTYGTFAVVIGLLTWLYLLGQIIVLAAEVNVVLAEDLWPRSLSGEDLTDADRRALARYAKVEERVPPEKIDVDLRDSRRPVDTDEAERPAPATPR
jgi:membrane protein